MPICPECEQTVQYQDLDVHQRYCGGAHGSAGGARDSGASLATVEVVRDRLERQLTDLERRERVLERREQALELAVGAPTGAAGIERSNTDGP